MSSCVTKICPFCSKEIKVSAIKCKHCGLMLSDVYSSSGSLCGMQLARQAIGKRYKILEEISLGGMATVYKAVQKNLNKTVALKVVHQNLLRDN